MAEDPFPRERVGVTLRRLPAYLKLAWRLARDPLLSRARRGAVVAAAGYLASPIDLVPDAIPVLGRLDDIAVALAALRFALAGLDADRRREHLAAVGREDAHLADDLRTVGVTTAWVVRAGARTTGRAARTGSHIALGGARVAGRTTVRTTSAASSAASRAAPAARSAASRAGPAAMSLASSAGPAAKGMAAKAGPAAKGAASRGAAALKGAAGKRPSMKVRVSIRRLPVLGPGEPPVEERLVVEPDVIELHGPGGDGEA